MSESIYKQLYLLGNRKFKMKDTEKNTSLIPIHFCLISILIAVYALPVSAHDPFTAMTVTANRASVSDSLAPATVITRADIERLQINDLPTLLSKQPGIDLVQYGGSGKLSSIFIRGTNSNHVLVLVDGVKWHAASAGSPSFQHFPVAQIERIEIVRGSRSALYGAEAVGGVIHIFTRQGRQGLHPYTSVAYGTHDSKRATIGVSGGNALTSYNISVNHQKTKGISARDKNNPDRDGYRNNSISATIKHQLNNLTLNGRFLRAEGFNEFDSVTFTGGSAPSFTDDSVQQVISTQADLLINDAWSAELLLGESRDQQKYFVDRKMTGMSNTHHRFANITNRFVIASNQTINIGLDYTIDDIDSRTKYRKKSRNNKAAFVSWQASINKHSWLLSARHDKNEAFGTYNTAISEWGYWLSDTTQITANVATAFKAPSFNELYWPRDNWPSRKDGKAWSSIKIKPEESKQYQLGLKGSNQGVNWEITMYRNKIKNLISGWPPENINKATIKGMELTLATMIQGWDIVMNTSFLQPKNDKTGKILTRRTQRLANLNIDKTLGQWSIGSSWKLRDHSFNQANEEDKLGGYGLLDLRASYQVHRDWLVKMSVNNALNKDYATARSWNGGDYNSLGRIAVLALSYQP